MKITEIDAGSVTLGPVGWLTGEAADEWSAAHGQPGGAPNGFVPAAHLRFSPYWATVSGGVVTRIDEQYIP